MSSVVTVTPIYGWGWFGPGDPPIVLKVPSPFEAKIERDGDDWVGKALSGEFRGLKIRLSARTQPFTGDCNLELFEEGCEFPQVGYAMIPLEAANL
ncbi:MAG: hypothetical protein ACRCS5_06090 [Sphingomonas sp.]|uniref:hypothetical protein n=1 Tax=Sphingomonas sp. TaxID=28214 RepID=UPI003F3CB4E6